MGHTAWPTEIADATAFLLSILPDDPAARLEPKDPTTMTVKELKTAVVQAGLAAHAKGFSEKNEFVDLLVRHRKGEL